ncbi:uncharacterized protein [Euphorbia lathyris]|uniref:uncharacterized protein n=1 Tax=Euphorbia lathyris TaxID=212925 RepID=UPI003313F478
MESSYDDDGYGRKAMTDVSLQELRDRLAEFAQVRGWEQYHSPRDLLLALVGGVGELSEIFQWKGEVEKGLPKWIIASAYCLTASDICATLLN